MQINELLTQTLKHLLSDDTKENTTGKKMHIYNKENTDTVIDPIRIFPKAFHFANNQNTYLGGRKHKKWSLPGFERY